MRDGCTRFPFWVAALFSVGFSCTVAQTHTPPQSHAPNAAQVPSVSVSKGGRDSKKVWTEDELAGIRKPWDVQQDRETVAKEQADKAMIKSGVASVRVRDSGTAMALKDGTSLPETVEAAEGKISALRKEIAELQSNIAQTNDTYFTATDHIRRTKLQFNLDEMGADVQERQDDLRTLQARLEFLQTGETHRTSQ